MNKLVSRVKLIAVGWEDTKALRILKNQYNRNLFQIQREEYADESEMRGLTQKVMGLQGQFEHNQDSLCVTRLAIATIRKRGEQRQALFDELSFLKVQIDNYE
jgi:rRNA processing protein Krr1/Pno1